MDINFVLSLSSLILSVSLALFIYVLYRRISLILQAVNGKAVEKVIKAVKSSRKLRKRYMIFEVISDKDIDKNLLEDSIRNSFSSMFGKVHLARASLTIPYYDSKLRIGVLKFTHVYKYKVLTTLGIVRSVGNAKVLLVPIRTTGTFKKALKYLKSKSSMHA